MSAHTLNYKLAHRYVFFGLCQKSYKQFSKNWEISHRNRFIASFEKNKKTTKIRRFRNCRSQSADTEQYMCLWVSHSLCHSLLYHTPPHFNSQHSLPGPYTYLSLQLLLQVSVPFLVFSVHFCSVLLILDSWLLPTVGALKFHLHWFNVHAVRQNSFSP